MREGLGDDRWVAYLDCVGTLGAREVGEVVAPADRAITAEASPDAVRGALGDADDAEPSDDPPDWLSGVDDRKLDVGRESHRRNSTVLRPAKIGRAYSGLIERRATR